MNGEAVMRMVLAACHRGFAAVIVTHDAQLASWADRVVFIRDGRMVDQTMPPSSSNRCSSQGSKDRRTVAPVAVSTLTAPPTGASLRAGP